MCEAKPIVCSPEDAYRCFMRTAIDVLVLKLPSLKADRKTHGKATPIGSKEFETGLSNETGKIISAQSRKKDARSNQIRRYSSRAWRLSNRVEDNLAQRATRVCDRAGL
jgi:hypothetical protein